MKYEIGCGEPEEELKDDEYAQDHNGDKSLLAGCGKDGGPTFLSTLLALFAHLVKQNANERT